MAAPSPLAVTAIEVGDDPSAWTAAGFTVDGKTVVVGGVRILCAGADATDGARGVRRWALTPTDGTVAAPAGAVDGLALLPADTTAAAPDPPVHPNGTVGLDHLVVFSPDVDRTTDALLDAGLDVRRVRPIPRSEPRRVQVFFRAGEVILELVGPERPAGDGPASFYGLAFTVADLDATAAALGDRLSEIRAAVQPGRRIATLRHRDLGLSVPVAFLSEQVRGDAARSEASPA